MAIVRQCRRCGKDFVYGPESSARCGYCSTDCRFDAQFDPNPTQLGCWMWTGATARRGYGTLSVNDRSVYAHRFALERRLGRPLGERMFALHECDTPGCVNPDHLFEGTVQQNAQDMVRKGRHRVGARRYGDANVSRMHPELLPRGADHWMHKRPDLVARGVRIALAKLDDDKVRAMRTEHAQGVTFAELARKYGVSEFSASSAVKRRTWKHVE